jgi:hypothetical protein
VLAPFTAALNAGRPVSAGGAGAIS